MPRALPGLVVAFLLAAAVPLPVAVGQDPLPQVTPAPSGERIQYVGPDTYILLDAEGHPQPLPGMTYEDFLAAWKKLNQPQTSESKPAFTIESIRFAGKTHGQRAELDFEATVRLLADGRAVVPLGLVGTILQGEPRFDTAGSDDAIPKTTEGLATKKRNDEFLTYDPEEGGFIAHLDGRAGERRTISFGLIIPLVHDGAETTLPLNCPRALSSQLNLTVDSAISAARTSSGAVLSQEPTSSGETVVKVAGPAGLFRLTWQAANKDAPALASVLHALGTVRVTIDGRGIRSDARLTVRSYGGSFDQFRVRLPAGAQLVPSRPDTSGKQDAGYRIRVESDSTAPDQEGNVRRQIAVIELPEKQQGPVVVDFSTEQAGSVEDRGQDTNLSGFEVLGAVRQFGDVAFNVSDDWQARWTIGSYVRQVDPSELEASLQTPNPTAAFQYDRQPWALKVRVTPRQLRVHVTPRFDMECLPDETRLQVRLAYQVFGARAFEFRVDLNGWQLTGDPVESGGLVDQDRVVETPEALVLPLAQASSRRAEIAFSLRRPVARDELRLELPLPVPLADSVGTGELTVHSTPDIELLPDLANSAGLVSAPSLPAVSTAGGDDNGKLHFRTLLPAATFVTDRSTRPRDVLTVSTSQIEMQPDGVQVDARINYVVRYEPIGELVFEMPEGLSPEADRLELQLITTSALSDSKSEESGTPLHINASDDESAVLSLAGLRQLRVMLPQPRIGRFAVRIRYRLPPPQTGAADLSWSIPLIHAADGKLTTNQVVVRSPRGVAVALDTSDDGNSWQPTPPAGESDTRSATFGCTSDAPELFLPLSIHSGRADSTAVTAIERVWLQTWFSKDFRQDRAAFRFRTSGDQVTVELPPAAAEAEFELLIDKEPAEIVARATGRIVVRVSQATGAARGSGAAAPTAHTLELRYRQAHPRNLLARHHLTPPQIEGSTALSQVYWHVVLPADEHIVYSPQQLASASQWQWLGTFWGRQPLKSQGELETWAGAAEQPAPVSGQSEYVFTGLLPVASIELATMPRWLIVLTASAATLAMAAAWLYLPKARRKWLLAIVAIAISVAAITYPTAALLLAQASMIGLVLAVLSVFLTRLFARPARVPLMPILSPSSQRMATPRTDSMLLQPVLSGASTAPTASLRAADSER